jgi:single-stranded DNA-binding protein
MTAFRLMFAGEIKTVETKNFNGIQFAELSLCKKNYAKQGTDPTFTWVRVGIREPADFLVAKLVKGAFIAGSGEMSARTYQDKDGKDKTSIDIRCTGFDVEMPRSEAAADFEGEQQIPQRSPARPRPAPATADQDPPF